MRPISSRRGASLVEAVVAMTLLALLVLFVLQPLAESDRATAQVASRRAALGLAGELMDQLQTCKPAKMLSGKGVLQVACSTSTGQKMISCPWSATVTELTAVSATQPGRYRLQVTVAPPTGGRPIVLESERAVLGEES